jgi:hypothetical protein
MILKKPLKISALISIILSILVTLAVGGFLFLIDNIDGGTGYSTIELYLILLQTLLSSFAVFFIPSFIITYLSDKLKNDIMKQEKADDYIGLAPKYKKIAIITTILSVFRIAFYIIGTMLSKEPEFTSLESFSLMLPFIIMFIAKNVIIWRPYIKRNKKPITESNINSCLVITAITFLIGL